MAVMKAKMTAKALAWETVCVCVCVCVWGGSDMPLKAEGCDLVLNFKKVFPATTSNKADMRAHRSQNMEWGTQRPTYGYRSLVFECWVCCEIL